MSDAPFARPAHRKVAALLAMLDCRFLEDANCFFGGGTRIVLELGEYRESRDIDFLCADRDGYRLLRETVTEASLGQVFSTPPTLAREVRSDQYGIRTFIAVDGTKLKFEIIRESRIDIEGDTIAGVPVACLTRRHCFAEKFLANADRGHDTSTLSRDVVDLAFMTAGWPKKDAEAGFVMATAAYGDAIGRTLAATVDRMRKDLSHRRRCLDGLAVTDTKTLAAGLKALAALSN
jgi:hypothetical protein